MSEIPPGILPDTTNALQLTIAIEFCGEFGQSYVASTPPKGEPEERLGVEADLSGAAAKRRLIAMLRRSGYSCPIKVVSGSELDCDPDYYLRHPRPDGTISRKVERAVDLSALLLDQFHRDWYEAVDASLLEQGPNPVESDSSVLAQLYEDHDEGMEILERDINDNPRILKALTEEGEPFLGFEPSRLYCEKYQRQFIYDLFDLYWRIELLRRQDLYSF